ncbi:hypothetical protein HYDPIDRAFT_120448 [Hydnomerulius pinastri MD-312]|uniref:Uncharacterized protein n=1 Tax=Hydnomerulius pinastri MD-312 TaxID=994086 RepID=A0A0C9VWT1_9AGAM|nr:hypothetical protein HYDPIDRAFT_120448 [Hydnomerulius pinastri MD-312]
MLSGKPLMPHIRHVPLYTPRCREPVLVQSGTPLGAFEPSRASSQPPSGEPTNTPVVNRKAKPKMGHPVVIEAGSYAAEVFAAHGVQQHVSGLIVVDGLFYVWRYDQQGPNSTFRLQFHPRYPALPSTSSRHATIRESSLRLEFRQRARFRDSPTVSPDDHRRRRG